MDRDGLFRRPVVDRNGVETSRWSRHPEAPTAAPSTPPPVLPPDPAARDADPEPDYVAVCPVCDWRGEDWPFWTDAMTDRDEHVEATGHHAASAEPVA